MKSVLFILAILQMLAGAVFALEATSAIHQILAAIAFGFGTVCIGLGGIIARLEGRPAKSMGALPEGSIAVPSTSGSWKRQ